MSFLFAWAPDNDTLEVWLRRKGQSWECWRVTPNADREYELHAWGRRVFACSREMAELLVRLLPY